MLGPINTLDAAACADVYTDVLGWPIAPGHRHRPRQGCTCGQPDTCPAPGAHPHPGQLIPLSPSGLAAELNSAPGAALIAPTTHFDAIVLPRERGMAAMALLDRVALVPCLVTERHATLFVLPSTGRYALASGDSGDIEVRTGGQWVALPPSHGVRWDTPPWHEQAHRALHLLHGRDLRSHLETARRAARAQGAA